MKREALTVTQNREIAPGVFEMALTGDLSAVTAPGQFVNIALPGRFLRRPISVCQWTAESLTIIYKVVGTGTADLSRLPAGETLDVLTGLGNGYDIAKCPGKGPAGSGEERPRHPGLQCQERDLL